MTGGTGRPDPHRPALAVISAGLRQPSSTRLLADRLAAATVRALDDRRIPSVTTTVELREHARDLTNSLLAGFPAGGLPAVIDGVLSADALIVVTPVFNGAYSGLFKTFFDVLEAGSLAGRPVLMGATGGTVRHSLALEHAMRPMFSYLGSLTVPTAVFAGPQDWGDSADDLDRRIRRAGRQLADLLARVDASAADASAANAPAADAPAPASVSAADADPLDDPALFDDPVPFERLLAGE